MFDDMIKNITDALADIDSKISASQGVMDTAIAEAKKNHADDVAALKDQRKKLTKALGNLQGKTDTQVVQD